MISFAKKFLSVALAAVLLVGVVPAAAFAAEADATEATTVATVAEVTKYTVNFYGETIDDNAGKTPIYTAEVEEGKSVDTNAVSVTAPQGSHFVKWVYMRDHNHVYNGDAIVDNTNLVPVFEQDAPAPHEHDFKLVDSKDATCTEAGYKKYECACGEKKEETIAALGHKFGDWVVTKKPTTDAKGEETRTCSVCGGVETREIDKLTPAVKFTVSFKTNCDVADPASITVTENGTYDNLPALTRTGYTFQGWYYGDTKVDNNSKIATNGNHTLEARWAINEYTVTFLKADGTTLTTRTVKHGQKIDNVPNVSEAGTQAGQHASKWDTDTNQVVTGNMTIKPLFSNNTYTITLDPGVSGLETKYKNVVYGDRIGDLPVPSRNRYVFKGWYLDNTEFTANTTYNMDHDITLKAKWVEEARVKLMIYRNGKTSSAYDEVQLYGYGVGDVIKMKDVKIENYYKNGNKSFKFSGWYDREGWTLFKAGDNPKPIEQIKTVGLDGTTVLFGMVTDSNASNNTNPDNSNPKTGDESMIFATTAVMLISAGALAVFFMDRKRRNG